MKIRRSAIAFLLLGVALAACGPRKICPQYSLYYEPAPLAPVHAAVVVNQCSEKGPNTVSVVVYQAGAEMQMNTHQRAVTVKDKSEGKQLQLRKHGGPFVAFEWKPDGLLEVFYDEKAELVNARTIVEGGAIKAMAVKYTPIHCFKEDEELPPANDRGSRMQCLPEPVQK
jgi:hypothetical protein